MTKFRAGAVVGWLEAVVETECHVVRLMMVALAWDLAWDRVLI